MSCLIIFSHVKYGLELAEIHKLGKEITDMICQHHGTRMPMYFYNKAVKQGENPKEADFRYAGPRPQTKEAAILMMADTLEAAVRSLPDPSSARISSTVETLIKNIYAEGQFDEADLTFKDLSKLIDGFTRMLIALNHQRINYQNIKVNDPNTAKEEEPKNPEQKEKITEQNEDNQKNQVTANNHSHEEK